MACPRMDDGNSDRIPTWPARFTMPAPAPTAVCTIRSDQKSVVHGTSA